MRWSLGLLRVGVDTKAFASKTALNQVRVVTLHCRLRWDAYMHMLLTLLGACCSNDRLLC